MGVIAGILLGFLLIAAAGIVTGVLIIRALYRSIRRNRTVRGVALRTRVAVTRGPQHQVLKLRLRLADSLESGRAAVEVAQHGAGPHGEVARLFRRIQAEGATVETQLRLLQSEADPTVLATEVPIVRDRVEQLEGLVRSLRSAVTSALAGPSDDTLAALQADVDREVAALHAGVQELHTLHSFDAAREPRRQNTTHLTRGNES
ncbi:hypothetical protein ACFRFH_03360 [Leifsonia sp. NPDC056824]|uniref:hypothetical protein n=1 Tax=Leifsonia sp. NPDC056824 TaxID=3345953 RepID=UPI0036CBEF67